MIKKHLFLNLIIIVSSVSSLVASSSYFGDSLPEYESFNLPELSVPVGGHKRISYSVQYGEDWGNAVGIARMVTLDEAIQISNGNPLISFFIYARNAVILSSSAGNYRRLEPKTAVFFSGAPTWAPEGDVDGYVKL